MSAEEILGVFPAWSRDKSSRWLVKVWTHKLVFTTNRLIFTDVKKRTGRPMLVGDPEYVHSRASRRDRLQMQKVSPQAMLDASAGAFEIPYSDIAVVEMQIKDLLIFTSEDLDTPKHTVHIAIRDRHMDVFEEFLRTVLHTKV